MGKIIYNGIDCGGGGGDEITITPVLSSGTKIADYTIDGTNGSLYAPSGNVTDVQIDSTSIVSGGVANIETMTGASSSTAGAKGLVPAPASGDNTKYLRGDGTWQDAQGASAVSDLTDVSLSSLTNGQILKYNSTSQKWENAAESGGGGSGNVDDVYVNGTSVLDANHIAQVTSYKELTQAQYDALPASKLTDGILYCIKDTGINEGDKFTPIIYSTEEHEVGVWSDGNPLYQKTLELNVTIGNTVHSVSALNIDSFVDLLGWIVFTNGASVPLNYYLTSSTFGYGYISDNMTNLVIYSPNGLTPSKCYATIQYTKTTDVPGSGNWTTSGVPAVHYSTDEQIIGTWIDGKTIYQKTITNVASGDILATGVDTLIDAKCKYQGTGNDSIFKGFGDGFTLNSAHTFKEENGSISYAPWSSQVDCTNKTLEFVTIQYTKITD